VDPVEATGELLSALRRGSRRSLGLGRADDRWFTFAAGVGLDAQVVRRVEAARTKGRPSTVGLYVRSAAREYLAAGLRRGHPVTDVRLSGGDVVRNAAMVIVLNCSPWTYLGNRALRPSPQ